MANIKSSRKGCQSGGPRCLRANGQGHEIGLAGGTMRSGTVPRAWIVSCRNAKPNRSPGLSQYQNDDISKSRNCSLAGADRQGDETSRRNEPNRAWGRMGLLERKVRFPRHQTLPTAWGEPPATVIFRAGVDLEPGAKARGALFQIFSCLATMPGNEASKRIS